MAYVQRLPKAVMNASARADELLKSLEELESEATEETVEVQDNTSAEPIVVADVPPVTAPVEPTQIQSDKTAAYWEHRFKTLQGIQEAEKRRHLAESAQQGERLTELEKKLKEQPVQVVPKEYDIRQYIPKDVLDTYGDDMPKAMLAMATKIGKEVSEDAISTRFKPEVESLTKKVDDITKANLEQRKSYFWETLEAAVPDYQTTNVDPAFHAWLSEVDPVAGVVRQEILGAGEANLNARQVVSIFKAFSNLSKPAVPHVPARPSTRVIPESSPSMPPVTDNSNQVPLMSAAEFGRISSELARGKYNKNPALKARLEKQVDEAIRTGRIG